MAELDDIETAIIASAKEVAALAEREHWGDKIWTKNLLQALGSLGSKDFNVRGHYREEIGSREWLYDQVWLDHDPETHAIMDVRLILESEWSTQQPKINEDFRKLLLGRAQHRVMIFQHKNDASLIIEKLKAQVRQFKRTEAGDRYLFLGWQFAKNYKDWKVELFVV